MRIHHLPARRLSRLSSERRAFLNLETGLAAVLFAIALALQSAFLGSLLVRPAPGAPAVAERAADAPGSAVARGAPAARGARG